MGALEVGDGFVVGACRGTPVAGVDAEVVDVEVVEEAMEVDDSGDRTKAERPEPLLQPAMTTAKAAPNKTA